jgi:HlyD family secretion protein
MCFSAIRASRAGSEDGASNYVARIAVTNDGPGQLGDVRLIAGMPVKVFVGTSERSMISCLTKPMADQIARAFREK